MSVQDIDGWYETQKWYKLREMVFKRDQYTCKDCGRKLNLQVHHIKRAKMHPELFFEESNCITLCKPCHDERHHQAWLTHVYNEDGFGENHPSDMVLCGFCGNFYHEARYKMCYDCYLKMRKGEL